VNVHLANLLIDLIIVSLWCAAFGVLVWKGTRRFVPPDVRKPWPNDDEFDEW
jgi:hypothetical protein